MPNFGQGEGQWEYQQPSASRARHIPFSHVNSIDDDPALVSTVFQNNGDLSDDTTTTPDEIKKVLLLLATPVSKIYGFQVEYSVTAFMTETIPEDDDFNSARFNLKYELIVAAEPWDPTTIDFTTGDALTVRSSSTVNHLWQTPMGAFNALGGDQTYELGQIESNIEETIYFEDGFEVTGADATSGFRIQGVKITLDATGYNTGSWDASATVRVNNLAADPDETFSFGII